MENGEKAGERKGEGSGMDIARAEDRERCEAREASLVFIHSETSLQTLDMRQRRAVISTPRTSPYVHLSHPRISKVK